MTLSPQRTQLYSIIIAIHPDEEVEPIDDWRLGEISVDWVDFTREKSVDQRELMSAPASRMIASRAGGSRRKQGQATAQGQAQMQTQTRSIPGGPTHPEHGSTHSHPNGRKPKPSPSDPDALSLQPLLAHFPGPNPLDSSVASGVSQVGRGVVHLFKHAPPASLIASLDAHPVGESSKRSKEGGEWAGEAAEGEDGSLIAILAVPAWMRPADFLEFIGGWGTCLEGVRMIREATTPNRSIVLLKFRDPLQASDFLVIFTGRAFSTLDARETCHPIRIHHLVLHKIDPSSTPTASPTSSASSPSRSRSPLAIPAFPPSVYASRARALDRQLPDLLSEIPSSSRYELPSCPVCLERLDSTVTGLVTLPCAHTFDCDCLQKWGDSRCPVCRVSHLLLSSTAASAASQQLSVGRVEITRMTSCSMCGLTERNWICVVCGVVGCGRYDPGKGHARRHWEESGHVLAMELETQRVWDYKGDNYVHRLIQTRNDGKLVELPSASSLVTSISRPLPLSRLTLHTPSPSPDRNGDREHHRSRSADGETHDRSNRARTDTERDPDPDHDETDSPRQAGPSHNDIDKISTIEAITLEYSYLLSSQLEAMRQHYEKEASSASTRLKDIEVLESRAKAAEDARREAERAREKAERKADKAAEVTRTLQASLSAEKAMSEGLSVRVGRMRQEMEKAEKERREVVEKAERVRKEKEQEVKALEETVRDLMFSLEAGATIAASGGTDAGEGGDLVVVQSETKRKGRR